MYNINNNNYKANICQVFTVSGTGSTSNALSHLILFTALEGFLHYYVHFADEKTEALRRFSNPSKALLLVNDDKARIQTQSCPFPHSIARLFFLSDTFLFTVSYRSSTLFSCIIWEGGEFFFTPQGSEKRTRPWENKSEMNLFLRRRVCERKCWVGLQKGRGYSGLRMCFWRMHGNEWEKQKVNQDRAGSNGRKCDRQQRKGQSCLQKQRVND